MHDCLTEAMDLPRWMAMLQEVKDGTIKFFPIDTREPSPFSHQILNANPYSFLDDAPLEERRTRAVTTRRSLSVQDFRDLAKLDPEAITQVSQDAWPLIRDADELHDALLSLILVFSDETAAWNNYFQELVNAGRTAEVTLPSGKRGWIAADAGRWCRWCILESSLNQYRNCRRRCKRNGSRQRGGLSWCEDGFLRPAPQRRQILPNG